MQALVFRMAKTTVTTPPPAAPLPASYEDALRELERLVADMESAQLPLDKLIDSHRRGAELLAFCRSRLEAVESQVKVLEDGQLKPWIAG
jgi:exodeoxyribonuclease VII small subunit